ncbi:MAG TPA: GlsB/YeaQ/YmgE family stress response membrane protein [Stellaceae bacterium]|nr:GlsB/YeaQ/YmgE family stress response membrane protein [Stellaceae bacterium]
MSSESLLVILFVGVIAGFLAGKVVRGAGFGLIGDLIVGIIGAFIGDWLLPRLGLHLGTGIVGAIFDATIGAIVLLLVVRLIRGGSSWQGSNSWGGWRSRRL